MIRFFDFLFALLGLIIFLPLIILIFLIGLIENGSPLFIQKRIGYKQKLFTLIKVCTILIKILIRLKLKNGKKKINT